MGGRLWGGLERTPTYDTLTNAACKLIDIVSKNADYRRPMSRMNLVDTTATPTYSVCRHWAGREPLAGRSFNSDSAQLPMTLQNP